MVLEFINTGIRNIACEDLQTFPFLRRMVLFSNQIEVLSGDLFKFSEHLEIIDSDFNQLKLVGPNLLMRLTKLSQIYLATIFASTELRNFRSL